MYEFCRRLIWNALWNDYEMMIWIDYELSDLNYATGMKTNEFMYEKVWIHVWKIIFQQTLYMKMYERVFYNSFIVWKCVNYLDIVSYEVCIIKLGLNDTGRARRDTNEAL